MRKRLHLTKKTIIMNTIIKDLPFMMYSFSAEPGRESALNKLLSSCSIKGAISTGVMLEI